MARHFGVSANRIQTLPDCEPIHGAPAIPPSQRVEFSRIRPANRRQSGFTLSEQKLFQPSCIIASSVGKPDSPRIGSQAGLFLKLCGMIPTRGPPPHGGSIRRKWPSELFGSDHAREQLAEANLRFNLKR